MSTSKPSIFCHYDWFYVINTIMGAKLYLLPYIRYLLNHNYNVPMNKIIYLKYEINEIIGLNYTIPFNVLSKCNIIYFKKNYYNLTFIIIFEVLSRVKNLKYLC